MVSLIVHTAKLQKAGHNSAANLIRVDEESHRYRMSLCSQNSGFVMRSVGNTRGFWHNEMELEEYCGCSGKSNVIIKVFINIHLNEGLHTVQIYVWYNIQKGEDSRIYGQKYASEKLRTLSISRETL